MIRSKSSSSLKGILILPFPLAVQDNCTLEPKNPHKCFCSIMYSSDNLLPVGRIFFPPLSTASPAVKALTISSTLRTEYPCDCISLKIRICVLGSSNERRARAWVSRPAAHPNCRLVADPSGYVILYYTKCSILMLYLIFQKCCG